MTKEEVLENLSDTDLELAIKEIRLLDKKECTFNETMVLCEVYSTLNELDIFEKENYYMLLCLLLMTEYSYRKAGLK